MMTFLLGGFAVVVCIALVLKGYVISLIIGGIAGSFIGIAGFGTAVQGALPGAIVGALVAIALGKQGVISPTYKEGVSHSSVKRTPTTEPRKTSYGIWLFVIIVVGLVYFAQDKKPQNDISSSLPSPLTQATLQARSPEAPSPISWKLIWTYPPPLNAKAFIDTNSVVAISGQIRVQVKEVHATPIPMDALDGRSAKYLTSTFQLAIRCADRMSAADQFRFYDVGGGEIPAAGGDQTNSERFTSIKPGDEVEAVAYDLVCK